MSNHEFACPACGYNMKGITVPRCPECGTQVKLVLACNVDKGRAQLMRWFRQGGDILAAVLAALIVYRLGQIMSPGPRYYSEIEHFHLMELFALVTCVLTYITRHPLVIAISVLLVMIWFMDGRALV